MSRNRKIPSMFRTPGRLLRSNRRYYARRGLELPAHMSLNGCAQAVHLVRESIKTGRVARQSLVIRDVEFMQHHPQQAAEYTPEAEARLEFEDENHAYDSEANAHLLRNGV